MVIQADAIIDPRAVVIKALHTLIADATVTGAICANDFTVGAEKHWIKNFHHFHEGDSFGALKIPRILTEGGQMQN